LDGTVNFVHHVPHVSVSIALWEDGAPLVGVVYDVARQEEFAAIRGRGATLNGELIRVTGVDSLSDAMILTGFPYDQREHPGAYLQQVERFLVEARAVRVIGSAALDLAWIAAGRADAYTEHGGTRGLKPWDMAAGSLLVTEAGGRFTDVDGRENVLEGRAFVASNGHLHERVASLVRETMPAHLRCATTTTTSALSGTRRPAPGSRCTSRAASTTCESGSPPTPSGPPARCSPSASTTRGWQRGHSPPRRTSMRRCATGPS